MQPNDFANLRLHCVVIARIAAFLQDYSGAQIFCAVCSLVWSTVVWSEQCSMRLECQWLAALLVNYGVPVKPQNISHVSGSGIANIDGHSHLRTMSSAAVHFINEEFQAPGLDRHLHGRRQKASFLSSKPTYLCEPI